MKTAKMEERMEQRLWSSSSAAMHLPERIFFRGEWWSLLETRDSREIRRDAVGSLTKAFVTLSQTQQIRPILSLSQIRPISSRNVHFSGKPINYPRLSQLPGSSHTREGLFVLLQRLIGSPGADNS